MADSSDDEQRLVNRIIRGDRTALAELYTLYRPRLWRMVNFRLDPRLRGRVDPDDILQDAWVNAVSRINHFVTDASRSSFIWFRLIVQQTLVDVHRRHLGADKRSAARERPLSQGWHADSTSTSLAFHLQAHLTSPSSAVVKNELAQQLDAVLQGMSDIDREVLALRHFEQLSNAETALVLDMSEQAASIRYVRALQRLKKVLEVMPGFRTEDFPAGSK
jgi:RNA polymerase sigma-70 factor (ECF subfamily)|uniref:Sigma-70 family RNA polymerase sigma factor n=1 Tax=Schlesneria paludicola TaxID=360056 RepID=A0A7C4LKG5_9PLAN